MLALGLNRDLAWSVAKGKEMQHMRETHWYYEY